MQKMSEKDKITIDEIIEHCNKTCEMAEMYAIKQGKTQDDITAKSYWEHYQVLKYIEELKQYRAIGTVEELQKSVKEEDILKFYYIESEDKYVVGQRVDNFYYAEIGKTGISYRMSRYLPWGQHVIAPETAWKEYTYPSEPKEIPFFEWLQGYIKKECGATVEECREAVERMKTMGTNESIITISLYFEIHDADIYGGKGTIGYANTNVDLKVSALAKADINNYVEMQRQGVAEMCKVDKQKVIVISRANYEEETADEDECNDFLDWSE